MNDPGVAPVTVSLLRDARDIESLLAEWTALWWRVPAATPFQSPAWLLPWWRCFGWGEPLIIVVHVGGRLAALAPFFVADRVLRPIGIAISDYVDILLDPERPEAIIALCVALRASSTDWDEACLDDLPPDAALLRLGVPEDFADETHAAESCPVLSLPSGDLRAVLPRSTDCDLGRAWRDVEKLGPLGVRTDLGVFEALVRLDDARARHRGEAGVLADPRVRAFHRAALPLLEAAGLLRLYGIEIAGSIVAAYYGLLHRGRAYSYLQGFDPSIAGQSLGIIAIGKGLAAAVAEGSTEFHFLRGGAHSSYLWGAVDRYNRRRRWERR